MTTDNQLTIWQRWVRQPQRLWLRRALFQVHLWSGIGLGLYILMISVTGSVLVYRNELYAATSPEPVISTGEGPKLTDAQVSEAALRSYPAYRVEKVARTQNPDEAVDVWLRRGDETKRRLFDPRSGKDLGNTVPTGFRLVTQLISLHDDLLGGPTGRKVNGIGAVAVVLLAMTGLVIWWPGIKNWRRSLMLRGGVGWKRFNWDLHSMVGFWSLGLLLLIGISGIYLCFPEEFQDFADRLQPPTSANAGNRIVDSVTYWLAYLHIGRVNGIGLPCSGPGLCDQATKATWAFFGMAPAVMFVTGAIMWWNRVVRGRLGRRALPLSKNLPSDS